MCSCCGRSSRCAWGLAYVDNQPLAAYYVHWTPGHVADRGSNIDFIVGKWGEGAASDERSVVSLAYRLLDTGPALMVIDAQTRPLSQNSLAAHALSRKQVIGTPLASTVFAIVDALLTQDERLAELLGHPMPQLNDLR